MADVSDLARDLASEGELHVASEDMARRCVNELRPHGYVVRYHPHPEIGWKVWVAFEPGDLAMETDEDGAPVPLWDGDAVYDNPRYGGDDAG